MAERNRSERLTNVTNHSFYAIPFCTGIEPSKTVTVTIYLILMLCSLLGNLFIVAVFFKNKSLRTNVHYFIMNMAISDLIIPVIYLPRWITIEFHGWLWLVDGVLGTVLCKLVAMSLEVSYSASMLSMIAIAAHRFHAVLFSRKLALFTRNKRRLIITATWVMSVTCQAYKLYVAKLINLHGIVTIVF